MQCRDLPACLLANDSLSFVLFLKLVILLVRLDLIHFATGVVENGSAPSLANISANFQKIQNEPYVTVLSGAWGKMIHGKPRSKKSRVTVPLIAGSPIRANK